MAVSVVRAAGGVIVRAQPQGTAEIALVHRPSYDDWTLPKGKLQAGESEEQTALREVEEETGMRCRIERALGTTKYFDHRGRHKIVHYWVMRPLDGEFRRSKEVDDLQWMALDDALRRLTYDHDRTLVRAMAQQISTGGLTQGSNGSVTLHGAASGALYLVRHAKAGNRSQWKGPDEERPLSKSGRKQALGLVGRLAAFSIARIVSSPHARCVQTIEPLARQRGLAVERTTSLAEGTDDDEVREFIEKCRAEPTVLCSHGDVVGDALTGLIRDGLALEGNLRWEKGSTWILEHDGETFLYGRHLPPP